MKSVAIIYASEGTGHKCAAVALQDYFYSNYPNTKVVCLDILDFIPKSAKSFFSGGYLYLSRNIPSLWGWMYNSSNQNSFNSSLSEKIHDFFCKKYLFKLENHLNKIKVDTVFFTHYFGAEYIAKRNSDRYPVFYINTDFLSHKFQRSKHFAHTFVASTKDEQLYKDLGYEDVTLSGIPILNKFNCVPTKIDARRELSIPETDRVILLYGGGIGAGHMYETALNFNEELQKETTVLIICGTNEALYKKLKRKIKNPKIRIFGFVRDIELFYAASDLTIMKAGGLSISECLAVKLPMLFVEPLPGQETENQKILCSSGSAVEEIRPDNVIFFAQHIVKNSVFLDFIKGNMAKITPPNPSRTIAEKAEEVLKIKYAK